MQVSAKRLGFLVLFALMSAWFSPPVANASPLSYEEQARLLARALLGNPAAPERLLDLAELRRLKPYLADSELVTEACNALARRELPIEMRVAVETCRLDHALTLLDMVSVAQQREALGVVDRFRIIGPFDNEGGLGMESVYPPETEYSPDSEYPGKERPVSWRDFPARLSHVGRVDFASIMNPDSQALAYAYARIHSAGRQRAVLLVSVGGEARIWLNGKPVFATDGDRRMSPFQDAVAVTLEAGANDLLVKNGGRDGEWAFRVALLDSRGRPLKGVTGLRADGSEVEQGVFPGEGLAFDLEDSVAPAPLVLGVDDLMARHERRPGAALALAISKLLDLRRNFPIEARRAEEWADRALALEPEHIDALLWCNEVYGDVNRRYGCLTRGHAQAPDDPRFSLLLASFYEREQRELASRRLLLPILDHPAVDIDAQALMADLEGAEGLEAAAFLRVTALAERHPKVLRVRRLQIDWLDRMGRPEAAAALAENLLETRPGDRLALERVFASRLDRRDTQGALALLEQRLVARPWELELYLMKAWIADGMGRLDVARENFLLIRDMVPDHTTAIEELAQLEHRQGNTEEALVLYRRSLEIRPQNPELVQYIQVLAPDTERFEAPYVRDIPELIVTYPPPEGTDETAEVLADVAVWKVFENGLSHEFNQQVVRVLNDNGVKQFKTFTVAYSPDSQRVKVLQARIFKPDGSVAEKVYENDFSVGGSDRMYYDRRVTAVSFPDLKPGDVVEFRYRLEDVGSRNLFADYFGGMRLLQNHVPVRSWETVILMPASRPLYYNSPRHAPEPLIDEEEGVRRYVWKTENTLKIPREPSSPGLIEIADFLHVSTFRDWEAMSRWYWGLIRDQFIAKEELRRTVAELVTGVKDPLERIRILYDWVLRNTRYVALEFGIHSFKPYQVNEVFQRRFGDCKDKATLLIVMLNEAGIDAVMAIIRTSNMGRLPEPYPPSLAMFNHAIVYVPQFDLYLDATAEHAGVDALPYQDRRGQVLLVGPQLAEFTVVPPPAPDANLVEEHTEVHLDDAGQASVTVTMRLTGNLATQWRSMFQEGERRREVLEKHLNRENPGAELVDFAFDGLEDSDVPVSVRYTARLPKFARAEEKGLAVWAHLERSDLVARYASLSRREHPVEIARLSTTRWKLELVLPDGMQVLHLPEALKRETPAATFASRAYETEGRIVVEAELVFRENLIQPESYAEFREFCQDVTRSLREEIRLSHERHN